MPFTKTEFDHTLITSQFLNDLQDEVLELDTLARSRQYKQFLAFNEANKTISSVGETANCAKSDLLPTIEPILGDVVIGTTTKRLAVVSSVAKSYFSVTGLGITLGGGL